MNNQVDFIASPQHFLLDLRMRQTLSACVANRQYVVASSEACLEGSAFGNALQ